MARKKVRKKKVTGGEIKREVFAGNKGYERIVLTKTINVGHLKETYYDIRIFNVSEDNGESLHPTKKGVTISERTLKRICVFLIKDLLSVGGTLE